MLGDNDNSNGDGKGDNVGYRRPPSSTRFVKGRSGNPAGRPPARHREAPYEAVLGQMVTILDGAIRRRVTAAEAFLLKLAKRGIEGDGASARTSLALIEQAREQHPNEEITGIILTAYFPDSVTPTLETLGMATNLDRYSETARVVLESWLVEAALVRLLKPLSPADQRAVVECTLTPKKVRWPEWWSEFPQRTPDVCFASDCRLS